MNDGRRLCPKPLTIFIAFFLAAFAYLHNNILINWADEGFLWYGASQTLKGFVPIRDFQSYDPGRYYWCASVFSVFGDGIMSLRLAVGLFQFLGLSFALLTLRRLLRSPLSLLGAGILAVTWMLMPFRYFDSSFAMITLYFTTRLVEKPSVRRNFSAGVFVGITAFFGLNHALYALLALLCLWIYLKAKGQLTFARREIAFFVLGFLLGLAPLWVMFSSVPHFRKEYTQRFLVIFNFIGGGRANMPFTILWPWEVPWPPTGSETAPFFAQTLHFLSQFGFGFFFIFLLFYYLLIVPVVASLKKIESSPHAVLVASTFVGGFYALHIAGRPDIYHAGEGAFPLWAGLLALLTMTKSRLLKSFRVSLVILFVVVSMFAAGPTNNIVQKHILPKEKMIWHRVGADLLWLPSSEATFAEGNKKLINHYVRADEPILLTGWLTTFYSYLNRESPVYELYFVLPPSLAIEQRNVREMKEKKVNWALVSDYWPDRYQEYSLSHSHPLLWKYLAEHFADITPQDMPPKLSQMGYRLMKRKLSSVT